MSTVTLDKIVKFALEYCPEYPKHVDWYDLIYRIEVRFNIDLPENFRSPEIREIIKAVNKERREHNPIKNWTGKGKGTGNGKSNRSR